MKNPFLCQLHVLIEEFCMDFTSFYCRMASRVLCATLAIPIPASRNAIDQLLESDEGTMEKKRRLAQLLMLQNPPKRTALIKDLVS